VNAVRVVAPRYSGANGAHFVARGWKIEGRACSRTRGGGREIGTTNKLRAIALPRRLRVLVRESVRSSGFVYISAVGFSRVDSIP